MEKIKIKIDTKGNVSYIYNDSLASLSRGASIVRVSNVEPTADGFWQATMLPSGKKLGKHLLRKDALAEEVSYIERELLGVEA